MAGFLVRRHREGGYMLSSGIEDGGACDVELEAMTSIWKRATSPKRGESGGEGMCV